MRISGWSSAVCSSDLNCPSSRCNLRLIADWAVPSTSAARVKLCRSAASTKALTAPIYIAFIRKDSFVERSEERLVGKECVRTCKSRCATYLTKNKQEKENTYN